MARARRTLDRRTLRDQNEAAERKKGDDEKDEVEEETDEDEDESDEEESEDEAAAGGEDEDAGDAGDAGDDDDDEDKPKKKKVVKKKVVAKKAAKVKAPTKPRTRAAKIVRMKVVWAVYSNSHALLQEFAYPLKADAEAYLEKVTTDKKSGGPFFMQPLKKPIEKEA